VTGVTDLRSLELWVEANPPRINIEMLSRVWDAVEASIADWLIQTRGALRYSRDETELDGWGQGEWRVLQMVDGESRCQTTLCLAGWTVETDIADRRARGDDEKGWLIDESTATELLLLPQFPESGKLIPAGIWVTDLYHLSNLTALLRARPDDYAENEAHHVIDIDGVPVVNAGNRARRLLGLTGNEATDLFAADNDLETLRGKVYSMVAEEKARRRAANLLGELSAKSEEN